MAAGLPVLLDSRWRIVGALMFALLAVAADGAGLIGAGLAGRARAALAAGQPGQALVFGDAASRWDPWQPPVAQLRCVTLKRLGRWPALAEAARASLRWSPDAAPLALMLGEAEFRLNHSSAAAEALWRALRLNPRPVHSAAQLWRMAMLAGRQAWGPADPRVAAAATEALRLVDLDQDLPPADRAALRREAGEVLHFVGK